MTETDADDPGMRGQARPTAADRRADRLKQSLRANLKRRKAQQRARGAAPERTSPGNGGDPSRE